MSVLERQRAMFQRLYHHHQEHQPQPPQVHAHLEDQLHVMSQFQQMISDDSAARNDHCSLQNSLHNLPVSGRDRVGFPGSELEHPSFSTISSSSITAVPAGQPKQAQNQGTTRVSEQNVAATRKRKAECDVDQESSKGKFFEGEAGEVQSGITVKCEMENSGNTSNENSKLTEVQKKPDYIHVRARRGQATDSHSLAERARREKISKKMKCLQDLVPGCNKVTGKAGMLDEIINYVQSLQKQVEFLSMKLATVNPSIECNLENLIAKQFPAYLASFPATATPMDVANQTFLQYDPMQKGVGSCGVDASPVGFPPAHMIPQKPGTSSMSIPEAYFDSACLAQIQQLSNWETDWQSLFNLGFQ